MTISFDDFLKVDIYRQMPGEEIDSSGIIAKHREMFFKGYEVAAVLGKDIYERVRPLPTRMVKPLGKVGGGE